MGRARRTPRFCYKASAAQETQCRCLDVAQDETCQMQASRDQVRGWPAGYLPPNGLFDIEAPQHPVFSAYKLGLRCPPRSPTYVVALYCPPTLLSPSAPCFSMWVSWRPSGQRTASYVILLKMLQSQSDGSLHMYLWCPL